MRHDDHGGDEPDDTEDDVQRPPAPGTMKVLLGAALSISAPVAGAALMLAALHLLLSGDVASALLAAGAGSLPPVFVYSLGVAFLIPSSGEDTEDPHHAPAMAMGCLLFVVAFLGLGYLCVQEGLLKVDPRPGAAKPAPAATKPRAR